MDVKIKFGNFTKQLLPSHKRKGGRSRLFRALSEPLIERYNFFDTWRSDIRRQINMTGQVGILEGYLRHKHGDASIRIETYIEHGFAIGMQGEGVVNAQPIGKDPTDTDPKEHKPRPAEIPLQGEIRDSFGDVDFVVYVSQGLDIEAVKIDIERFKQVLTTYKIIAK